MTVELPTLTDVLMKHRWHPRPLVIEQHIASCECGWTKEIVNTHKSGIQLHAEHVMELWTEPRTIRTVEQLDALPEGAVIHCPRKLTASSIEKRHDRWWPSRSTGPFHHGFRDELLPATLIWPPDLSPS